MKRPLKFLLALLPFAAAEPRGVPPFAMHIHAYYTDELASDLREHCAYGLARRIVVTTDTERKRDDIQAIFAAAGRSVEVRLAPNRGRDILPFMDLFRDGGAGFDDEIWCHLHQKKSIGVTEFDELAVMVDTFRPLELGEAGTAVDDGKYAWSWVGGR